jgi:hypothetical protein
MAERTLAKRGNADGCPVTCSTSCPFPGGSRTRNSQSRGKVRGSSFPPGGKIGRLGAAPLGPPAVRSDALASV